MSDDFPDALEREFEAHEAFDRADGTDYALSTTVFDGLVTADDAGADDGFRFRARVAVPTLDAAVADETVAPVVEEGWLETFERRLGDVYDVARTTTHEEPDLESDDGEVRVLLEYVARDAGQGVADAKALIEFVEGTYVQGLVPGYEYRGSAATLLESAQERGQRAGDGGDAPL